MTAPLQAVVQNLCRVSSGLTLDATRMPLGVGLSLLCRYLQSLYVFVCDVFALYTLILNI